MAFNACDPCACIPSNISEDSFNQAALIALCGILTAIQAGGGGFITAVGDTDSVNLTVTGTTLTADVEISADAGNQLTIEADGLFVATPAYPQIGSLVDYAAALTSDTGATVTVVGGSTVASNKFYYQVMGVGADGNYLVWVSISYEFTTAGGSGPPVEIRIGHPFTLSAVSQFFLDQAGERSNVSLVAVSTSVGQNAWQAGNAYLSAYTDGPGTPWSSAVNNRLAATFIISVSAVP